MNRTLLITQAVVLFSWIALPPACAASKTTAKSGFSHGHKHIKKRLIAKGIKTYGKSSKRKAAAPSILKGYINNLSKRINESWESYRVNVMRAEISLQLDKDGNIVSTKVKSAKAGSGNVNKAIEAVKFATPFGALPGGLKTIRFNLKFTDRRVTVEKSGGTASNTVSKSKASAKSNRSSRKRASKRSSYRPPASNKPMDVLKEAKELYDFLDN